MAVQDGKLAAKAIHEQLFPRQTMAEVR